MTHKALAKRALGARKFSYSPFSRFRVGAAVLTSSGRVFTGSNIESSSYSLTICAERTAIFKAISEGQRKFKAIAIATDASAFTPPCGACRQIIYELAGDIDVILTKSNGQIRAFKAGDLLPLAFTQKNLNNHAKFK